MKDKGMGNLASGKQLHSQQENAEETFRFSQKQIIENLRAVFMEY